MLFCKKCSKRFDEQMYNRICPKCGYYNRIPSKYDVEQYFVFDENGKVSTSKEAQVAHERMHREYDQKSVWSSHNGHNPGQNTHDSHEVYQSPSTYKTSTSNRKNNLGTGNMPASYGKTAGNTAGNVTGTLGDITGKLGEVRRKNPVLTIIFVVVAIEIAASAISIISGLFF